MRVFACFLIYLMLISGILSGTAISNLIHTHTHPQINKSSWHRNLDHGQNFFAVVAANHTRTIGRLKSAANKIRTTEGAPVPVDLRGSYVHENEFWSR